MLRARAIRLALLLGRRLRVGDGDPQPGSPEGEQAVRQGVQRVDLCAARARVVPALARLVRVGVQHGLGLGRLRGVGVGPGGQRLVDARLNLVADDQFDAVEHDLDLADPAAELGQLFLEPLLHGRLDLLPVRRRLRRHRIRVDHLHGSLTRLDLGGGLRLDQLALRVERSAVVLDDLVADGRVRGLDQHRVQEGAPPLELVVRVGREVELPVGAPVLARAVARVELLQLLGVTRDRDQHLPLDADVDAVARGEGVVVHAGLVGLVCADEVDGLRGTGVVPDLRPPAGPLDVGAGSDGHEGLTVVERAAVADDRDLAALGTGVAVENADEADATDQREEDEEALRGPRSLSQPVDHGKLPVVHEQYGCSPGED